MPYPILDLSASDVQIQVSGKTDPKSLADQLAEVRDAIGPVLAGPQATVQSLLLSMTVDPDGSLAFVSRGAPDASVVMTFSRPLT
jgi:hypothetical protein